MYTHNAPKKPAQKDWHWEDIKAALRKVEGSFDAFAAKHDLSRSAVTNVKNRRYPHVQRLIAEAIGTTPELIWPSRYTACNCSACGSVLTHPSMERSGGCGSFRKSVAEVGDTSLDRAAA